MSSSNLNLYAGAFLGTVFAMMTVGILGEAIFNAETPETAGFAIKVSDEGGSSAPAEKAAPTVEPVSPLLASADAAAGEKVFKKCAACHDISEGGPNKVGPNLWGVLGRKIAAHEGFKYSTAMHDFAQSHDVWTYELLNLFTHKPKDEVPGTAMGFAGLSKVQDRANLIAYLREQSSNPEPLPSPDAAADTTTAPASDTMSEPATTETAPADTTSEPAATEGTTQQ